MTTYTTTTFHTACRTAVFVDFDNIHIQLERAGNQAAARAFANRPHQWFQQLCGLIAREAGPCAERRVLVARCYLGGARFACGNFVRAGFEVVDCQPLTKQGKNAADIRMVIDVLDLLATNPNIDEFIIVSSDADFTPLLHRLRAADKRTVIVTASKIACAYERTADVVVAEEAVLSLLAPGAASQEEPAVDEPAADESAAAEREVPATEPVEQATAEAVRTTKSLGELRDDERAALVQIIDECRGESGCTLTDLTKKVRNTAAERGIPVSRNAVNRLLGSLRAAAQDQGEVSVQPDAA